ncbi:MAG: transposase, partial [Isosphaeraceae bacterium]
TVSSGQMALGIYKGNGRVFTLPVAVPSTDETVKTLTEAGQLHFCDETLAYTFLDIHGNSVVTNSEKGMRRGREIPEDIEGFWAFAQQWLKHYRGVPRQYFPLYLKEIEWRFNHRSENLVKLIRNLLDQRALTESELLGP